MDYNMREAILAVLEKNSRIDLADLAALLGVTEAEVANEISIISSLFCFFYLNFHKEKTIFVSKIDN